MDITDDTGVHFSFEYISSQLSFSFDFKLHSTHLCLFFLFELDITCSDFVFLTLLTT